jgi:alpha-beta hydrolase superfamily lysophospholipase
LAWLHAPENDIVFDHGVVLCSSVGHEQVHAYRGIRHLAEVLAQHGVAVLRFDWYGTGDSAGDDAAPALVANWQANVRDAVAWMKIEFGLEQVSVIGFRMGGLLAVEAWAGDESDAEDLPSRAIENLVLWAPVTSGRAFTRELRLVNAVANSAARTETSRAEAGLEAGGFRYSAETLTALTALQITGRGAAYRQALLIQRDDVAADGKLAVKLAANGAAVETRTLPGVKDLLVEPHYTHVPRDTIAAISDWLLERIQATADRRPFDSRVCGETSVRLPVESCLDDSSGADSGCRETIWRSPGPALAGIVCEPAGIAAAQRSAARPLIVLLNSGAAYRIGVGRLNVLLARRLAKLGFRSLRFDLRGLGDSPAERTCPENDTYPSTGFADLAAALEAAKSELGHARCVFLGLCSGAYFAFQAAAQSSDPALVESIVINPLTYYWREGMTIDDPELRAALESQWRFTRKLDGRRIWKFLTGRSRLGYFGAAREAYGGAARFIKSRVPRPMALDQAGAVETDSALACQHPLTKNLPRDLLQIARSGRKLTMFLAQTDPGEAMLYSQARRQAKQLIRQGVLTITHIADADHTFSQSAARRTLIEQVAAHLGRTYPLAAP